MVCLRVPPELLLPACPPACACCFSTIETNLCLFVSRRQLSWHPRLHGGALGDHQADILHNVYVPTAEHTSNASLFYCKNKNNQEYDKHCW